MIVVGRLLIVGLMLAYVATGIALVGEISRAAPSTAADLASR